MIRVKIYKPEDEVRDRVDPELTQICEGQSTNDIRTSTHKPTNKKVSPILDCVTPDSVSLTSLTRQQK